MWSKTLLTLALCAGLAPGCRREIDIPGVTPPAKSAIAIDRNVRDVCCGCALHEGGQCGNYIKVDGKFIELVRHKDFSGDIDLSGTPFCKKKGLRARVEGDPEDGKFLAWFFEYVDTK